MRKLIFYDFVPLILGIQKKMILKNQWILQLCLLALFLVTWVQGQCESNPCQNGATCNNGVNEYQCACAIGYTGNNCETVINYCVTQPCLHNGTCIVRTELGTYECVCENGFSGTNCENIQSGCSSSPCQMGGKLYASQQLT